jgi:hypothetical protein
MKFDIFKYGGDGEPLWVEASPSMDAAKVRVQELAQVFPGDYLILSHQTGEKVSIKAGSQASDSKAPN